MVIETTSKNGPEWRGLSLKHHTVDPVCFRRQVWLQQDKDNQQNKVNTDECNLLISVWGFLSL